MISFFNKPWKAPVPSFNVKKIIAPCPRIDIIRPAIHLFSFFFSNASKFRIASLKVNSLIDSAGYGFIPCFRKSSSFFILASLISSIEDIFILIYSCVSHGYLGYQLRHTDYFIVYHTVWSLKRNIVAFFFAKKRLTKRGSVGYLALCHICLFRSYYNISFLFFTHFAVG